MWDCAHNSHTHVPSERCGDEGTHHDLPQSTFSGFAVDAAVDGAFPKVHLVLGERACLVAENVFDLPNPKSERDEDQSHSQQQATTTSHAHQGELIVEVGRLDSHVAPLGAHLVIPLHEPCLDGLVWEATFMWHSSLRTLWCLVP